MHYALSIQAEDGIRAHCVTGVQTCALPIFEALSSNCADEALGDRVCLRRPDGSADDLDAFVAKDSLERARELGRSEERRVGKECSGRGLGLRYSSNATGSKD